MWKCRCVCALELGTRGSIGDMTSIIFYLATICIASARVLSDHPGSYFSHNTPTPPLDLNEGEVFMKDAILYLTPSQIKAFEASQGQTDQRNSFSEEDIQKVEAEIKRQLERQNIFAINQNSNERMILKYQKPPPPVVEEPEPITETPLESSPQYQQKWIPMTNQQEDQKYSLPPSYEPDHKYFLPKEDYYHHRPAESYSYIKFFTDDKVHETPKLQFYHPNPQEHKIDPELAKFLETQKESLYRKPYKLVPYKYKTLEIPELEDIQEIAKLTSILEKNNKEQSTGSQTEQISEDIKEKSQEYQTSASQFDNHKQTEEVKKFLMKIEKENAQAKAEAILNSQSTGIRKNASNRRPIPVPFYQKRDNNQR